MKDEPKQTGEVSSTSQILEKPCSQNGMLFLFVIVF